MFEDFFIYHVFSLQLLDPIEDEKLCVFLLEKALSKLPAGQHKILGIFDLRGFGSQNADLKFLTFLVYIYIYICIFLQVQWFGSLRSYCLSVLQFDVFYYYYPSRLDEVLFVDAPFIFQPIWQFTKPLVKSYASLVSSTPNDSSSIHAPLLVTVVVRLLVCLCNWLLTEPVCTSQSMR